MDPGRTRQAVHRWPLDKATRQILCRYLDSLPADSLDVPLPLVAADADWRGADLSDLDLAHAYLPRVRLDGVRLRRACLVVAVLRDASLKAADLVEAELFMAQAANCLAWDAVLRRADLTRADLSEADLRGVDLRDAWLDGACLREADLREADLRGCRFGWGRQIADVGYARLASCRLEHARGIIRGPVRVGERTLDGDALATWLRDHGAPLVRVLSPGEDDRPHAFHSPQGTRDWVPD